MISLAIAGMLEAAMFYLLMWGYISLFIVALLLTASIWKRSTLLLTLALLLLAFHTWYFYPFPWWGWTEPVESEKLHDPVVGYWNQRLAEYAWLWFILVAAVAVYSPLHVIALVRRRRSKDAANNTMEPTGGTPAAHG